MIEEETVQRADATTAQDPAESLVVRQLGEYRRALDSR